jgi:NADPH:quinone reductase
MQVVTVQADGNRILKLQDATDPVPGLSEAVVNVKSFSLNLGEVRRALTQRVSGWRPGWDFAGIVERRATDGSGPESGARVVGFVEEGAWAQKLSVHTRAIAEIPSTVTLQQAATLPVAGLTALKALEKGGLLLGRKVLVNGASGGVGNIACQLARASGAHVVAAIRREDLRTQLLADGATDVVVDSNLAVARAYGPFDLILESVGGSTLATALTMLAKDGICVTYGNSSRELAPVDVSQFYLTGSARLEGLFLVSILRHEAATIGLTRLLRLVENGQITPRIQREASWEDVDAIAKQLFNREITGKAVLNIP